MIKVYIQSARTMNAVHAAMILSVCAFGFESS